MSIDTELNTYFSGLKKHSESPINQANEELYIENPENMEFDEPIILKTNPDLIGPHAESSSILTSLDDGKVIGYSGLFNKLRETGSTIKFVVGYLGLKILGTGYDVHVFQWAIDECERINRASNDVYHEAGDRVSMKDAFASGFPMSDNVMAYSIAIAIGIEKCGINPYNIDGTENYEMIERAYTAGLEYMNNEIENMGFRQTKIVNAAGFNVDGHFSYGNYGYANDQAGSTSKEFDLIVNAALNDSVVNNAFINQNVDYQNQAFERHSDVIETATNYGINCNPGDFFADSPADGVYFIKSGTQGYKSAIMGVIYEGKKYSYVINGVSTDGDYLAEALYEIDSALDSNFYQAVENING